MNLLQQKRVIDFEPELVKNAQAYLECRRQGRTPDGKLTQAWEQFYAVCDLCVRRFALTCGAHTDNLSDCTQEVWKTLVAKLGEFQSDPQRPRFSTWLYKLVRNKAADQIRQRSRHPTASLTGGAAEPSSGPDWDPAAECERKSRREKVHCVLNELRKLIPERSYQILYMHWIEGRSMPEIAGLVNLKIDQVWARHHRAKQKFRRLFELYTKRFPTG